MSNALVEPTTELDEACAVLDRAERNRVETRRLGFERLQIARDWALANTGTSEGRVRQPLRYDLLGASRLIIEAFAPAELAVSLEISTIAALRLMGDAVDLVERHPVVWSALKQGRLEPWVARKIADLTHDLSAARAHRVDAQLAEVVGTLSPGRLLALVEGRVVAADQALADEKAALAKQRRGVWLGRHNDQGTRGLFAQGDAKDMARVYATVDHLAHLLRDHCPELAVETMDQLRARGLALLADPMGALTLMIGANEHAVPDVVAEAIRTTHPSTYRPRTTCYVHVAPETLAGQGAARAEELGPLTRQQLVELLGHEHVTLRPVIDLNEGRAADCYEVPATISERLHLARPADYFPYAQSLSRKQDQDHVVPYDWTGPPGQTRLDNLGHLTRHHHRVKTHAGWRVWLHDGRFTWITPHGRIFVTDGSGTQRVELYVGRLDYELAS